MRSVSVRLPFWSERSTCGGLDTRSSSTWLIRHCTGLKNTSRRHSASLSLHPHERCDNESCRAFKQWISAETEDERRRACCLVIVPAARRGGAGLPDKPWRVSILLFPFHSVLCWRDVGKWRLNYIYPSLFIWDVILCFAWVVSASSLMVGVGNRLAGLYFFLTFSSVLCFLETGNKK